MSTSALQSSIAPKQNNTPEIKGTTLSKPNFNPNANVLNQNLMTNYNQPQNDTIGGAGQMIKPQQPVDLPQLPQVSTPTPTLPTTPVESEADKYFKMYLSSLGITPEEEALQTQLSNLTTGADLGVAGLEGQGRGIPLNLVRGQQEKLLKQAAIQTQPLQKQLELLQARRQAEAEMAKAASDYYGTETYKPTTVGAGETLIDPVTGKVIYQGAPKASDFKSVGAGETLIDPTTGKVIYQGQPKEQSMSEKYGTGIIGEYNFYADQERQLGREPISFNEYQNIDANRKAKIAASSIADASGMTTKQNQNFMTITNKFQADKTIGFAEKGVQTIAIADQVLANPGSAINQLKVLYSLVKALDPDSAVREGELDLAQSTQSYLQK